VFAIKDMGGNMRGDNVRGKRGREHNCWKGGRNFASGYVRIFMPEHPRAMGIGYVFEHILIAEEALGKPLPSGAHIHHVNENRGDNRHENLVICQDNNYHQLLHRRTTALKECGHANWKKCWICKQWEDTAKLGSKYTHAACEKNRSAERRYASDRV
jgi:hypothetical protein